MTPHEHLCRLLLGCFEPDEFRRFLASRTEFQGLVDNLPGGIAPPAAFFHAAVQLLNQHRLVDHAFFDLLRAERPRRVGELDEVEACWSSDGASERTASANFLAERLPLIAAFVAFPIACVIAWRRPNQGLMFVGLYLCILAPWGIRERVSGAVAIMCGTGLLLGGVILAFLESREGEPRPA